jgi:hypothetical protein
MCSPKRVADSLTTHVEILMPPDMKRCGTSVWRSADALDRRSSRGGCAATLGVRG